MKTIKTLAILLAAILVASASNLFAKETKSLTGAAAVTEAFPDSSAWILTSIVGVKAKKMTIGHKAFIIITKKDQKLAGFTSCNFIGGKVSFPDSSSIKFTDVTDTNRSCDEATDKMEKLFRERIRKCTSWKIVGDTLYLLENQTPLFEFKAPPKEL